VIPLTAVLQAIAAMQVDGEKGMIQIEGPASADYIEALDFDENLNNFRKANKQKQSLVEIAKSEDGFIHIATNNNTLVGYVTFHRPDSYSRWYKHPLVIELGAIEVSPLWRKYRLGRCLLAHAFSNPFMEDHIVITLEYCWHWDLENTQLTLWQYQKMLTGLFGSAGLEKVQTDDPEILENPANVLMARVGKNVSLDDFEMFERLRFEGRHIF
jgi:acetoin utilization protein AcuA